MLRRGDAWTTCLFPLSSTLTAGGFHVTLSWELSDATARFLLRFRSLYLCNSNVFTERYSKRTYCSPSEDIASPPYSRHRVLTSVLLMHTETIWFDLYPVPPTQQLIQLEHADSAQ
ncbi:hypothetical protein EV356DRAFT_505568 [Viridothelium virens]|uniref:Uncharacterized protein n=1 Tax=Viridothelium virens TaxID=1048519 RepID=A0A6A6H2R1_VIRVR|nr:hypothetical protein EV356DRAFT_505568 [Viridothelium virens]